MAAAKTNETAVATTTAAVVDPIEEATQKFAALAEETTKQFTEFAEQAKATQKQQSLDAIDSYEQAVLALVDDFEKAATEPKPELTNIVDVTREMTTAYTAAARQLVG